MTPLEFLQTLWPDEGLYCLATPFKIPGTERTVFTHKVFETIEGAAAFAERKKDTDNIFFCVHTLKEAQVWNPTKKNLKTGELGAFEVRVQSNTEAAKAFFFDLDVGTSTEKLSKYATQAEALLGLKAFCQATLLPKPAIVSSGGGLHVYWLMNETMTSASWKQIAFRLKKLALAQGLKLDPMRTTDNSSVLRVAGTFNLKQGGKRPVEVKASFKPVSLASFTKLIDEAIIRTGITVETAPTFSKTADDDFNNTKKVYTGPPTTLRALVTACAQVRHMVAKRGDVPEPEWYNMLNLVRFVENGSTLVHKISEGHSNYSYDETERKVQQLKDKDVGPTTCAKLADVCGADRCIGCAFSNRSSSPIVAARFKDEAEQPIVVETIGDAQHTTFVPECPKPFSRLKDGSIAMQIKTKEGDDQQIRIFDHDLFPLRRLVNVGDRLEQHVWRTVLPKSGQQDFVLDADALYDKRKFVAAISNQGIFPHSSNVQHIQDYMIAYIAELQKLADAEVQCKHLGWTDDKSRFILPDKILQMNELPKPASLTLHAQRSSAQIHKKGSMLKQVALLKFYNHRVYLPHQFLILCGLAAPLFYATDHHGVIVNAFGDSGASKSTSLYTAASFWGQPELYPINGTANGATVKGRNERVTTLANLPICVDEITNMVVKEAQELAMGITQPGHRIRLEVTGTERASIESYKATIMLTTANTSLHSMLSTDNIAGSAGSMRVFEMAFKPVAVHTKSEADDYWHELKQNYGHIGEVFIQHFMNNKGANEDRIRTVMREIDQEAHFLGAERFWSAVIATVLVSGEIAYSLGLIPFDMALLRQWIMDKQVPYMRGIVGEEYANPMSILADYLETINDHILVMAKTDPNSNISYGVKQPRGELVARYEQGEKLIYVLKKHFKDYCVKIGANHWKIMEELSTGKLDANGKIHRVINNVRIRKVLGMGTDLSKAQVWCFTINMTHPEVTGAVDLAAIVNPNPPKSPTPAGSKSSLKLV